MSQEARVVPRPWANTNYAWVATVPLYVHGGGKTEPGDDSLEEDQVKPVEVVSHGVEDVSKEQGCVCELEGPLVTT